MCVCVFWSRFSSPLRHLFCFIMVFMIMRFCVTFHTTIADGTYVCILGVALELKARFRASKTGLRT